MPNHCYCTLTIDGPEADLKELRKRLAVDEHGHYCLFESVLPMPDDLRGTESPSPLEIGTVHDETLRRHRPLTDAERERLESLKAAHGHADWYSWQKENWGMKWGDCNTVIDWDDPLVLEFWTPWVPPIAGVGKIAEMYRSLTFHLKYDESNCELLGIVEWSGGKLTRQRAA
jgi:hypothetical protein